MQKKRIRHTQQQQDTQLFDEPPNVTKKGRTKGRKIASPIEIKQKARKAIGPKKTARVSKRKVQGLTTGLGEEIEHARQSGRLKESSRRYFKRMQCLNFESLRDPLDPNMHLDVRLPFIVLIDRGGGRWCFDLITLWNEVKHLEKSSFDLKSVQRDFGHIVKLRTLTSVFEFTWEDFQIARTKFYSFAFGKNPYFLE